MKYDPVMDDLEFITMTRAKRRKLAKATFKQRKPATTVPKKRSVLKVNTKRSTNTKNHQPHTSSSAAGFGDWS